MNILKSTVLFLLLAIGLSSCIVAGPGYRRGPGHYHGGGGHHHGGGHYRR